MHSKTINHWPSLRSLQDSGKKDFNAERDALIQRSREAADDGLHWSERWLKKVEKEILDEDSLYGVEEKNKAEESLTDSLTNASMTYLIQSRTLQTGEAGSKKMAAEKGKVGKAILKASESMCGKAVEILCRVEGLGDVVEDVLENEEGSLRFAKACNSMGTVLTTKSKYMTSDTKTQQLQDALKYLYKAYQIREFKLEETHDDVIVTLYSIASAYEEMGEIEEAQKVQEFILERMGIKIDADGNVVDI